MENSFDFPYRCLHMCAREHSVILLVNIKEYVVGDVKLDRKIQKNSDMLDLSFFNYATLQGPFIIPNVHNWAQCW